MMAAGRLGILPDGTQLLWEQIRPTMMPLQKYLKTEKVIAQVYKLNDLKSCVPF